MTIGQLELPLFTRVRCGTARGHVSHAYEDAGSSWGCPGVPDIREAA